MHKCASRFRRATLFPLQPSTADPGARAQGPLVAFTAYIWLLGVTSIAKVGTYPYVNPIVAVLLGWAVLGEPVTLRTVAAAAVILLGVALVNVDWRGRSA